MTNKMTAVTYTRKPTNNKNHQFSCIVCGNVDLGRKGQKFCSNACKMKDRYYSKAKEVNLQILFVNN
jgi:predicted nucleic acid-binding Zn ribbon protein